MIHAPNLMPDEDARAYWGRVLRLNAVPTSWQAEENFSASIRKHFTTEDCARPELTAVISLVSGMPFSMVVQAHTLVPFHSAVVTAVNGNWCDGSFAFRESRRIATHSRMIRQSLCPACVQEDIDFWGFSYWRRSQQLPGIVCCSKHGGALFRVRENTTWQTMPHEALPEASPESDDVIAHTLENPVLRRYTMACTELLHQPRPLSALQVVRSLQKRAKLVGLAHTGDNSGQKLSGFAADCISGPWLRECWSPPQSRPVVAGLGSLDATLSRLRGPFATNAYALAFALLYDSIDEAFNDLSTPLPPLQALLPSLNEEAQRPCRTAPPRTQEANQQRQKRLHRTAELILNGSSIHDVARTHGWAPPILDRILFNALLSVEQKTPRPGKISDPVPYTDT